MTGFSPDWLALRESFDHAARAVEPTPSPRATTSIGHVLQVVDLGSGTGANLREIAPRIGGRQRWRLVDHDPLLLAALPGVLASWAEGRGLRSRSCGALLVVEGNGLHLEVETCCIDMARDLDALPFEGADLVTASALLDLVSARWLDALVARCRAAGAAVWWALNVDDRIAWAPADPEDAMVAAQFHLHQRRDKGFGPALGGAAAACAAESFARSGYRVTQSQSDWQVDGSRGETDRAMLCAMVEGIAAAVVEQAPAMRERVARWRARKLAGTDTAQLRVGHVAVQGRLA